jgi:hypothetical protein
LPLGCVLTSKKANFQLPSWLYARCYIEGNFWVGRDDDEFQTKMKESEKRLEKLDEASLTRQPEEVSRVQDRIQIRLDLTLTRIHIRLDLTPTRIHIRLDLTPTSSVADP